MRHLALACLLLAQAGSAAAEDWTAVDGAAITAALSDRTLRYDDGAEQLFRRSGSTLYRAGAGESAGRWRVEGDRYCSVWPPSEHWACYALERDAASGRLRFLSASGEATAGAYADE